LFINLFCCTLQFHLPSFHRELLSSRRQQFSIPPQNRKTHSRNCRNGSPVTCTNRWCHLQSFRAINHTRNRDLCGERPLNHRSRCESGRNKCRGRNFRNETPGSLFATRPIDRDFDTRLRLSAGTKARSGHAFAVREESCNGEIGRMKRTRHRGDANDDHEVGEEIYGKAISASRDTHVRQVCRALTDR